MTTKHMGYISEDFDPQLVFACPVVGNWYASDTAPPDRFKCPGCGQELVTIEVVE